MNDNTFLEYLKSTPRVEVSKENLPEWLVARINNAEIWPSSISELHIYKGERNKQTVYFILDNRSSCLCDFYTKDGKRIIDNVSDLHKMDKNWILVYKYSEF